MLERKKTKYTPYTVFIMTWIIYVFLLKVAPDRIFSIVYCISVPIYLITSDYVYSKTTIAFLYAKYPDECIQVLSKRYLGMDISCVDILSNLPLKAVLTHIRKKEIFDSDPVLRRIYRNSAIYSTLFRILVNISLIPHLCFIIWGQ